MIYPPQRAVFQFLDNTPDGMGGTNKTKVDRCELYGYLDMLTADNDLAVQKAPIEVSKFVFVVKPQDNSTPLIEPKKGDVMTDHRGRQYEVTFVDDPVGIGHHLKILLDFLPEGVR